MALGPVLIFDKSTLQALNPDEAVWLDNFYLTNITPLFFVETLADLEKSVRGGRTPEDVVGNLAHKTPDGGSCPNVHHTALLEAELCGGEEIDMRTGRPIVARGRHVTLGDKTSVIIEESPEAEALRRWQRKEFLDVERLMAKQWRRALSNINYHELYEACQTWFGGKQKPKSLSEVKTFADQFIDGPNQEMVVPFGLSLVGAPQSVHAQFLSRWNAAGRPALKEFAPYFRHVYSVDLFFYLAIAADLISRERPSNKVDLAYFYYLPFCMVFASSDKLHARVGPLFLTDMQTFVEGSALKADLGRLDQHYSLLPEEIKNQGVIKFAPYPPTDGAFLVSQLWDKYLSKWRGTQTDVKEPMSKEASAALVAKIRQIAEEATPADPNFEFDSEHADSMLVKRTVATRKGKWKLFPPEIDSKYHGNIA